MNDEHLSLSATPSSNTSTERLAIACELQALRMRWILFGTVVVAVLLNSVAVLIHGPGPLVWATVQGAWVSLLAWLIRKLFS